MRKTWSLIMLVLCVFASALSACNQSAETEANMNGSKMVTSSASSNQFESETLSPDEKAAIDRAAENVSAPSDMVEYLHDRQQMESDAQKSDIVVTVNGKPIYQWMIDIGMLDNQITVQNGRKQINESDMPSEEKERLLSQLTIKSEEEILQQIIRRTVVEQVAAKNVEAVSDEEALQEATQVLQQLKQQLISEDGTTRMQAEQNYGSIKATYVAYGVTEDEYLVKYACPSYKIMMTNERLYDHFTAGLSDEEKKNASALYQSYIDKAVEEAKIKRN